LLAHLADRIPGGFELDRSDGQVRPDFALRKPLHRHEPLCLADVRQRSAQNHGGQHEPDGDAHRKPECGDPILAHDRLPRRPTSRSPQPSSENPPRQSSPPETARRNGYLRAASGHQVITVPTARLEHLVFGSQVGDLCRSVRRRVEATHDSMRRCHPFSDGEFHLPRGIAQVYVRDTGREHRRELCDAHARVRPHPPRFRLPSRACPTRPRPADPPQP